MDYHQYNSSRTTPSYPSYTSTSGFNSYENSNTNSYNREPRYQDSYGRSITNPLPAMFRTAAMASNAPSVQPPQFNYRPTSSNSNYDTPRSYSTALNSGYISDTNDVRRSTGQYRPTTNNNVYARRNEYSNVPSMSSSSYMPAPQYNTKITASSGLNDQSYYSDSECVTSGPRYYKITRQSNTRRPSNIVLPIRSMTSRAYEPYAQPESPKAPVQPAFDIYRYQQEQERLAREKQQQEAAARFRLPSKLTLDTQEQRRKSDGLLTSISH
jgi:hypothetical protein